MPLSPRPQRARRQQTFLVIQLQLAPANFALKLRGSSGRGHFYLEVQVRRPPGHFQFHSIGLLDDGERAPGQAERQESGPAHSLAGRAGVAGNAIGQAHPKQAVLAAMDGGVDRGMEAAGQQFPLERVPGLHDGEYTSTAVYAARLSSRHLLVSHLRSGADVLRVLHGKE